MNIKNLKYLPKISQDPSKIAELAAAIASSNETIRAEILQKKADYFVSIGLLVDNLEADELQRYNDWLTDHMAQYNADISELDQKYQAAQANLANIVSNAEGISDSISEFAADVQTNKDAVNADINTKTSTLENARQAFRIAMGTLEDFVLTDGSTPPAGGQDFGGGYVEDDAIIGAYVFYQDANGTNYATTTDSNGEFLFAAEPVGEIRAVGGYQSGDDAQVEFGEMKTTANLFEAVDANGSSVTPITPIIDLMSNLVDEGMTAQEAENLVKLQSPVLFGVDLSDVEIISAKSNYQKISEGIEPEKSARLLSAQSTLYDISDLAVNTMEEDEGAFSKSQRNSRRKLWMKKFANEVKGRLGTATTIGNLSEAKTWIMNAVGSVGQELGIDYSKRIALSVAAGDFLTQKQLFSNSNTYDYSKVKAIRNIFNNEYKHSIKKAQPNIQPSLNTLEIFNDSLQNKLNNNGYKQINTSSLYSNITREVKQLQTVISSDSSSISLHDDTGAVKYKIVNASDGIEVQNAEGVPYVPFSVEYRAAISKADSLSSSYPAHTTDLDWWSIEMSPVISTILLYAKNQEIINPVLNDILFEPLLKSSMSVFDANGNIVSIDPTQPGQMISDNGFTQLFKFGADWSGVAMTDFHGAQMRLDQLSELPAAIINFKLIGSHKSDNESNSVYTTYEHYEHTILGRYIKAIKKYRSSGGFTNENGFQPHDTSWFTEEMETKLINFLKAICYIDAGQGVKFYYQNNDEVLNNPYLKDVFDAFGLEHKVKVIFYNDWNTIVSHARSITNRFVQIGGDSIFDTRFDGTDYLSWYEAQTHNKLPAPPSMGSGRSPLKNGVIYHESLPNGYHAFRNDAERIYNHMSDRLKDMTMKMGVLDYLLGDSMTNQKADSMMNSLWNLTYHLLLHDGDGGRPDNAKSTDLQRSLFRQYLQNEWGLDGREWKKGDDMTYKNLDYNMLQVYAALVWNRYEYEVKYGDLKDLIPVLLEEKAAADAAAAAAAATAGAYYYYGGDGEGIGEDLL